MTNEERDLITQFITRVSGAGAAAQPPSSTFGGSVPATTQPAAPPLPPIDPQADQHIQGLFQQYREAPYRLTQLAFVQEHALAEAQNRIQRLEWELQHAQQAAEAAAQQQQQQPPAGSGGGFFGNLFGSRAQPQPQPGPGPGPGPAWNRGGPQQQQWQQQPPPPPPPQYAPNFQPGMFQNPSGTGFLGSALRSATGVAGGILAANALTSLFTGGSRGLGGGSAFGGGSGFAGSPWGASPQAEPGPVDQGTWDQGAGAGGGQNDVDDGTWDQPADSGSDGSSWSDSGGSDDGGSWDSGGGDDSLC